MFTKNEQIMKVNPLVYVDLLASVLTRMKFDPFIVGIGVEL